jgi:hypothetical protein
MTCNRVLGAFAKLREAIVGFVMSVRPSIRPSVRPSVRPSAWNNSATTERILMKFDILAFFENLEEISFVKSHKNKVYFT